MSWIWWRVVRPLQWHWAGWRERRVSGNIEGKTGMFPGKEDTMASKGSNTGGTSGTSPGSKGGQGGTGPGRPGTAGGTGGTGNDPGTKGDGVKN